jgi:2-aminoadipate transaminase
MAKGLAHPEIVSLSAGFADQESLPAETMRQAWEAVWSDGRSARAALQYGTTIGLPALREAILHRFADQEKRTTAELGASSDRIVITAGSNQFLYLVGEVLLDPGDIVLCGAPSYYVYLGMLGYQGARAIGVACDRDGLVPEAVEERLAALAASGQLGRVKMIYVTSYFDNPAGTTLSAPRRAALVDIAQRWSRAGKIYILEDIAYRELRYWGDEVPSIRAMDPGGETVILTGSFSKSFSPGLRVGWGLLPRRLLDPVLSAKGHIDFGSPNLNQALMAAVMERGLYASHLERLRARYREKLEAMLEAADRHLAPLGTVSWERPTGGLYVWLRMPEGLDTGPGKPLFEYAADRGVLYVPGEFAYPAAGPESPKNRLRLSFGAPSCDDIRRGVAALAGAVVEVSR